MSVLAGSLKRQLRVCWVSLLLCHELGSAVGIGCSGSLVPGGSTTRSRSTADQGWTQHMVEKGMFVVISHQDFGGVCYHSAEAKSWA